MADLRQLLSQGRKRIGLLVGAGAPLAIRTDGSGKLDDEGTPLISGVDDLTSKAVAALSGTEASAVAAIIKSLEEDPNVESVNIETILSRVRLLQSALGSSEVNGLDSVGHEGVGKNICAAIGTLVGAYLPKDRCAYNEIVSWISGTQRPHPIEVFTTNYDLLFEEAFEAAHAPYYDGFSGSYEPFFDPATVSGDELPARWSRLWKIHGSLGWKLSENGVIRSGGRYENQLVYPDHLKYDLTQKQPYSSLFERLKSFLLTPDTLLLTTGFSFRDSHICAVLDEALAMNSNSSVFAFQYGSLDVEESAVQMAYSRPNFSVFASDGAVINGVKAKWQLGPPPKNWLEIRATFWENHNDDDSGYFILGDFVKFCRFCALSQSVDFEINSTTQVATEADEATD
ncbi:MAG: SIR2 family protein [Rhodobacteraceae bacterium]|nr:MAG: SIR2 family protein [Paracoccaceae bacterium]